MKARIASLAAVAFVASGCINPFDPAADVEFAYINPSQTTVYYADVSTGGTIDFTKWEVTCHLVVKNKVAVTLTGVNIVYTDMDGNEVTAYRNSGGRNFRWLQRIEGASSGAYNNYMAGEGCETDITLFLVDMPVVDTLRAGLVKTMFATITFRGQDDNGYDVSVSATTTIHTFMFP